MMKQTIKSLLALVISFQLAGFPLFATDLNADEMELNPDKIKSKLEESFRQAEIDDWSFLNEKKEQINSAELVMLATKTREFYAVSPHVDELNARMTIHFKLEAPTTKTISFKLSVLDKNRENIISARKFVLSLNPDEVEATKLRFARAFQSMAEEIKSNKDQLAALSFGNSAFAALQKVSNYVIPRTEARSAMNTIKALKYISGGTVIIAIVNIVFLKCKHSSPFLQSSNGRRLTFLLEMMGLTGIGISVGSWLGFNFGAGFSR